MASYDNKVLTGDQLVYFSSLVKTALAGKADTTDIPDVSGKQDALVFNTAYDASTNKVATMSDIPDVSGKQDALVFNTAYDATNNKVATMSDLPDISGKQDALVFNTAYNASSNKVATMSDIPTVPTNVSDLTNDSGFQTASQVQTAINTALGSVGSFSFEIVQSLPQSNISTSKIYLVAKQTAGTNQVYTEYAYVNNGWEIIGDTSMTIDTLSNAEVQTIWNSASAS